jgi:hypothetical protein
MMVVFYRFTLRFICFAFASFIDEILFCFFFQFEIEFRCSLIAFIGRPKLHNHRTQAVAGMKQSRLSQYNC